jgi:hypothetical protein
MGGDSEKVVQRIHIGMVAENPKVWIGILKKKDGKFRVGAKTNNVAHRKKILCAFSIFPVHTSSNQVAKPDLSQ